MVSTGTKIHYNDWKREAIDILQHSEPYSDEPMFWIGTELTELAAAVLLPDESMTKASRLLNQRLLTSAEYQTLTSDVLDLARGKPLPLITGFTWFAGVKIRCFPDVLIPRPDSEVLVYEAAACLAQEKAPYRVLDLCTGSGCLSLGLAEAMSELGKTGDQGEQGDSGYYGNLDDVSKLEILATDISPAACKAARENVHLNGRDEQIEVEEADLWPTKLLRGSWKPTLVISNPPYLTEEELVSGNLVSWEPELALEAGTDGLRIYKRILTEGSDLLDQGTFLILEHGATQANAIRKLSEEIPGWTYVWTKVDMADRPRVTCLKRV